MAITIIQLSILMFFSYLIGAIPNGVIISKKFFGIDIRNEGSGNMGSTNISRVLGTKWGIIVQALDILKGITSVLLLGDLVGDYYLDMCGTDSFLNLPILELIIGMGSVSGHIFSCFVGFKGGKGINTAVGMLIAILPIELGFGLLVFTIIVGVTGFVSLGSLLGSLTLPVVLFIRYNLFQVSVKGYLTLIWIIIGFVTIVLWTHRGNIKRLLNGTESRMEKMRFIHKLIKRNE